MSRRLMALLGLCLLLPGAVRAETARVAVAISLKEAVTEIAAAYKAEGRGDVEFTFGSSGQLQAQIEYGAPIDAFISAAHAQVDGLVKAKRADPDSKRVVAGNRLVLIVPAGAKSPPATFKDLAGARVRRVAVGEPKTVPAGQYAMQALEAMGLRDAVKGRLVHGANVRQVLDYVERGEVDAGIVYATDAQESGERVRVVERADPKTHDAVEYPAVLVSNSRRREAARGFLEYLKGEKARAILAGKGFEVPARERPGE
jgi:molybdate transport system substrate-binding protein